MPRRPAPGCVLAVYGFAVALALLPLLVASVPPLEDYPDHLARMAVLLNRDPHAPIAANYAVHWQLVPDLAIDLVVPMLAHLLPLDVAGRVFIALTLAMLVSGTALLHRALFGRAGLWPVVSVLFLYNALVATGFLAVLFTFALGLNAFALWIASRRWPAVPRLVLFTAIASLLFVCHLFAFGIFGLLIAGCEAGLALDEPRPARALLRRSVALVMFAPAGALWLAAIGNMGPLYTAEGGVARKIAIWLSPFEFNDPATTLDHLLLVLVVFFLVWGWLARFFVVARPMRLPLAVLVIAAVLMPEWLSGSWGADLRLPVATVFVLLGSIELEPARDRRALVSFGVVAALLFALRIGGVSAAWRAQDRDFAELRHAIAALPAGARLLTVMNDWSAADEPIAGVPAALQIRSEVSFIHLDALAVLDRGAFIPGLFTYETPVFATAATRGQSQGDWRPLAPAELAAWARKPLNAAKPMGIGPHPAPCCYGWPEFYDYVLWIDFNHPPGRLSEHLRPWISGSYFHIYRVDRGAG